MPRRLTVEEAEQISSDARGDGSRPSLFNAVSGEESEISAGFEQFLILTSVEIRNNISTFFQAIIDNDPNQLGLRDQLLLEYIQTELQNEHQLERGLEPVTDLYDDVRGQFSESAEGFTDVDEVVSLQEALTNSLGGITEQRDRSTFSQAALEVLRIRQNSRNNSEFTQELRSWVRVLVEYE